jgi:hypothetical protein
MHSEPNLVEGKKNMKSSKNPLKETKNPSRFYNSITNLKSQHKPKYHLSKNPHTKIRPIIIIT